jgi:hypothetical protein
MDIHADTDAVFLCREKKVEPIKAFHHQVKCLFRFLLNFTPAIIKK